MTSPGADLPSVSISTAVSARGAAPRSGQALALTWRLFSRNTMTLVGLAIVVAFLLLALAAPIVAPEGYVAQNVRARLSPMSFEHLLGTDELGRDILARIVWGTRISLMAGVISVLIGMLVGVTVGMLAGYMRGVVDNVLMRLVDIMLSLPFFLLAIVIVSVGGQTLSSVMIAIGAWTIPSYARIVRSQTLVMRERAFVEAARALGVQDGRIILRHILPNITGPILVEGSLRVGHAILAEAALSFLGLGVPPPEPSWGAMLLGAQPYFRSAPWVAIFPGLAITISVLGFNLVGDGLRDAIDPKLRGQAKLVQ
jgi:ABC-type dipeptide/oligopeptide/nickel transport system permease subunit